MKTKIESNRVWLYLLFAFGIAWAIDLVIYMRGGLMNPKSVSLTRALLVVSMTAPALANILTRRITGEGWKDLFLQPIANATATANAAFDTATMMLGMLLALLPLPPWRWRR